MSDSVEIPPRRTTDATTSTSTTVSATVAPPPMDFIAVSDKGRVREHNEDSFLVCPPPSPKLTRKRGLLVVVADGMGGTVGGDWASRTAVAAVRDAYFGDATSTPDVALRRAVENANSVICRSVQQNPQYRGMGSTCSALALVDGKAIYAHVGDSRIYLLREGRILLLTDDHSKVADLLRSGKITPQQAASHPQRNVITRSLGAKPAVQVDVSPQPVPVKDGDRFVLCSDGLTNHVTDVEILKLVRGKPIKTAAEELVKLANRNGGSDNITAAVGRVGVDAAPAAKPTPAPPTEPEPAPITEETEIKKSRAGLWIAAVAAVLLLLLGTGAFAVYWFVIRDPVPDGAAGEEEPSSGTTVDPGDAAGDADASAAALEQAERDLAEVQARLEEQDRKIAELLHQMDSGTLDGEQAQRELQEAEEQRRRDEEEREKKEAERARLKRLDEERKRRAAADRAAAAAAAAAEPVTAAVEPVTAAVEPVTAAVEPATETVDTTPEPEEDAATVSTGDPTGNETEPEANGDTAADANGSVAGEEDVGKPTPNDPVDESTAPEPVSGAGGFAGGSYADLKKYCNQTGDTLAVCASRTLGEMGPGQRDAFLKGLSDTQRRFLCKQLDSTGDCEDRALETIQSKF